MFRCLEWFQRKVENSTIFDVVSNTELSGDPIIEAHVLEGKGTRIDLVNALKRKSLNLEFLYQADS